MQRSGLLAALLALVAATCPVRAAECKLANFGTIPIEMRGTQPTAVLKVNGQDTRFLVDTGSWFGGMSQATAQELGLKLTSAPEGLYGVGVGGTFNLQVTRVRQLGLLGASIPNVDFTVGGTDIGMPIIGANLLHAFDLELDLGNGQMRMMKATGCDKVALAYWVTDGNFRIAELAPDEGGKSQSQLLRVIVNGVPLLAMLDTGASATVIGRRAAGRAGLDPAVASAVAGDSTYGFGRRIVRTWTLPVDSVAIGDETIQHTRIQVMDENLPETGGRPVDMLLGIDFILAHRIYVSNGQHRMYFTYSGGRVFAPGGPAKAPAQAPAPAPAPAAAQVADHLPLPASEADKGQPAAFFAARASARQTRGDLAGALTDYDAAIARAPDQAGYYLARANARGAAGQDAAARADLAKALSLDPRHGAGLLMRARMHRADGNAAAALADVDAAVRVLPAGAADVLDAADLYSALDRPATALPLLDGWIAVHPVDARLGEVLNERCWARALANTQLDGALDDCRKAIKRSGANAGYLDSLGMVQLRRKAYAEAIAAYQQALSLDPRQAWSRYGLGLARQRNGQEAAGAADLAAAVALDPGVAERFRSLGI